jgi:hypothetical protein
LTAITQAAIAAFKSASTKESKIVALVVPTRASHRSLLKRSASDVLAPFSTHPRLVARAPDSKPLVPVAQKCFSDADTCRNQTDSCSGHGSCVEGARMGGGKADEPCYVCKCETTKDDGRPTTWSGSSCQKVDYSRCARALHPSLHC